MSSLDSLGVGDAAQMMQLATQAQINDSNMQIESLDAVRKRKSRFAHSNVGVNKRGRRWGLADDKPYKPNAYIDLPIGLSEKEVDQFLREQRLDDITGKMRRGHMEDVDPDIRPPSPPPVYDVYGSRMNTRDVRIKKAMSQEQNRLIRYMQKHIKDYVTPPDWKPQKLAKKLIIPYQKYPQAQFMGVIIGPRGVNHKRLQEITGCRIVIRGKEINDKWQTEEEAQMDQHVHIEADSEEQIEKAEQIIAPLLNPETEEFERARVAGHEQIALLNGYTLSKAEAKCALCGAMGHYTFECPENQTMNYKMANVQCTICGDKGHIAMDCPVAMREMQAENKDWKADAAKKREADQAFSEMMGEMGLDGRGGMGSGGGGIRVPANSSFSSTAAAPKIPEAPVGGAMAKSASMAPPVQQVSMVGASGAYPGAPAAAFGEGTIVDKSLAIPDEICKHFVGARGAKINQMKAETNCDIQLDPFSQGTGNKTVIIRGTPASIELAKTKILEFLKNQMRIQQVQRGKGGFGGLNRNLHMMTMGATGGGPGGMGMGMGGGMHHQHGGHPNMQHPHHINQSGGRAGGGMMHIHANSWGNWAAPSSNPSEAYGDGGFNGGGGGHGGGGGGSSFGGNFGAAANEGGNNMMNMF